MLKPVVGSLLALVVAVAASGCNKGPQPPAASAPDSTQAGTPASAPHPMPSAPTQAVDLSGIAKADGGKTVAELFAEKDKLDGQIVVVRAKVVKTNPNVMGKNWLHVRDGSGAEGTNDLTVTTSAAAPRVGDIVVVTGKVLLNQDFGMGYKYDVIVEDAEVTVQATGS